MKKLLTFTLLFLGLSFLLSAQNVSWLEGTWSGKGYQPDALNQQFWLMKLYYAPGGKDIIVSYPTIPCAGKWTLEKLEKNKAIFKETLTSGFENCIDGSKLVVSYIDNSYVNVSFYDITNTSTVNSIVLLKREK